MTSPIMKEVFGDGHDESSSSGVPARATGDTAVSLTELSHAFNQLVQMQQETVDGKPSKFIMATSNLLVSRYFLTTIQVGIAACLFSSDLINLKASSALSFLSLVCIFLCAKRLSYRGLIKRALRISVDTRTVLLHR